MTELSFAKSYLSLLDSRPIKLQADHISPPQSLELNGPYTLPRYPGSTTMHKPSNTTDTAADNNNKSNPPSSGTSSTITIHLKSSRNPTLSLTLPATPPNTSILDLKERIATELRQSSSSTTSTAADTSKIRILYQKKPCSDAKTIRDVVGDSTLTAPETQKSGIELSVMIMGYTASNLGPQFSGADAKVASEGAAMAQEAQVEKREFAKEVMSGEAFWNDLMGWVIERVRDDGIAEEVVKAWRERWSEGVGKGR